MGDVCGFLPCFNTFRGMEHGRFNARKSITQGKGRYAPYGCALLEMVRKISGDSV